MSALDKDWVGLQWQGAWSAETAYRVRDAVRYEGSSWIAGGSVPPAVGAVPGVGVGWEVLAAGSARPSIRVSGASGESEVGDERNVVVLNGSVTSFDLRSDHPAGFEFRMVSTRSTPLGFTLGDGSALGMTAPGVSDVGQVVRALVVSNTGDAAVWVLEGASEEP